MNYIKGIYQRYFGKRLGVEGERKVTEEGEKKEEDSVDSNEDLLEELFKLSCTFIKDSKVNFNEEQRLTLYGLYKQATVGNCSTTAPSLFDFTNKAKWDAWKAHQGTKKLDAVKRYINYAANVDPSIQILIKQKLSSDQQDPVEENMKSREEMRTLGSKAVQDVDFSNTYSHPYFARIYRGEVITDCDRERLLEMNESPKVYPLHFAIDRQQTETVRQFLKMLSKQQINGMKDEHGMGIMEYAQLMENEQILQAVKDRFDLD